MAMKADLEIFRFLNDALVKAEDEIVKTAVIKIQVNITLATSKDNHSAAIQAKFNL